MGARYLGIDYGTKRIGLAVSDPEGRIASPLRALPAVGDAASQVRDVVAAAAEYDVNEWVIGLPLNMDGSEGPQVRLVKTFAAALTKATDGPVHLWDERLSSETADAYLARTGLTHGQKKRRRDALAAQAILQEFLDHLAQCARP